MSDEDTTTTDDAPEASEKTEATQDDDFDPKRAKDKIEKANREAKSLRDRLAAAEKRLKDIDDATKSEADKAKEKVAELEKRAQEAESRSLRLEIAAEKGLSPSQAKRLVGSNREELEADADELLEAFSPATDDKREDKSRRPKEKLRPGASSQEEPDANPSKVADEILSKPF